MKEIEIRNVSFRYEREQRRVLEDFSLDISRHQITAILGRSGTGKSTVLKLLAGLLVPETGVIALGVDSGDADIGYMAQAASLLPWLTVLENLTLPSKIGRAAAGVLLPEQALSVVGLESEANKYPAELSGGMLQRVALARGMCSTKDLLLLDEPLSALDELNREIMLKAFCFLSREHKITIAFVTHSIRDALAVSNRVIVLGRSPLVSVADLHLGEEPTTRFNLSHEVYRHHESLRRALDE